MPRCCSSAPPSSSASPRSLQARLPNVRDAGYRHHGARHRTSPDWPPRFDKHRFEAALRRLASKLQAAREAFIDFRDDERASSPVRLDPSEDAIDLLDELEAKANLLVLVPRGGFVEFLLRDPIDLEVFTTAADATPAPQAGRSR